MPGCAGGAAPNTNLQFTSIILDAEQALGPLFSTIRGTLPWLAANAILGSLSVTSICQMNPADPGNPPVMDAFLLPFQPFTSSFTGGGNAFTQWLIDKVNYYYFQLNCHCVDTSQPPPPPVAAQLPTGTQSAPTAPDLQEQLTRIEKRVGGNADAFQVIYNGLQRISSFQGDQWYRSVPKLLQRGTGLIDHATDEGCAELPLLTYPANYFSTATLLVLATINAIPWNVAQRGTLNPKLYGVGSIYWQSDLFAGGGHAMLGRTSLHEMVQVLEVPRRTIVNRICWRLMSGVDVGFVVVDAGSDNVMFSPSAAFSEGIVPFGHADPGVYDPPIFPVGSTIYPPAARAAPAVGPQPGRRVLPAQRAGGSDQDAAPAGQAPCGGCRDEMDRFLRETS